MKLKCTVEQVLPMQSGTRANGTPWKSQQVVLSWMEAEGENQFTHRVVVTMMNETVDTFADDTMAGQYVAEGRAVCTRHGLRQRGAFR